MEYTNHSDAYRKLQELYADFSDSRIESMAENIDDLTEIAQQVLRAEVARRGLDSQTEHATPVEIARHVLKREFSDPDAPFHPPGSEAEALASEDNPAHPYQRGDKVMPQLDPHAYDPVAIWVVTDSEKARDIMGILDAAGIKSFLGPDNVESVGDFKGGYDGGIEVKVMKFQARFAQDGLRRVMPPEPDANSSDEGELSISCPKCNSQEVIFQGLVEEDGKNASAIAKNSWACDACGHQWEDDGIVEQG
jgi:hypothetical protein